MKVLRKGANMAYMQNKSNGGWGAQWHSVPQATLEPKKGFQPKKTLGKSQRLATFI